MEFTKYYNAKLLLTAEYQVLFGAKALAVPLRFGQRFEVIEGEEGFIIWTSIAHDGSVWFKGKYALSDFEIMECSDAGIATYPQNLLRNARKLNLEFCAKTMGFEVVATLNYPLLWGLGSSSTLIAAVAEWAKINPFDLHFAVSKGSGYDIACALSQGPLVYQLGGGKPVYKPVEFSPSFADQVYFVYQGQKQDSAQSVQKFIGHASSKDARVVAEATALTEMLMNAESLGEFEEVMWVHEQLISKSIRMPSIRETLFSDLRGEVKSLGAWGGDFCMLTWHEEPHLLADYLKGKGISTWFNYKEIVL